MPEDFLGEPDTSVVEILAALLKKAGASGASDLHIDPHKEKIVVRARLDGVLVSFGEVAIDLHHSLIARIKVLADLRTDIHAFAQDGRFSFSDDGEDFDVRVAIAPTFYGENAVLRLLPAKVKEWSLADLGFSEANSQKLLLNAKKPFGLILATGPTGSGKTTTLYALLKLLSGEHVATVTLEDPVEYAIEGVRHIAVNPAVGFDFAQGLKWLVRQNPDILLVGEIRDGETARAAIQTALTGHLLLSSLHTQDAAAALIRLLDLGIEPYLAASCVSIVVGQRLVRKLCQNCKTASPLGLEALSAKISDISESAQSWKGAGCDSCAGMGYSGRIGLQEVLIMDESIRELLVRQATAGVIREAVVASGMRPLFLDGVEKVYTGLTSAEEILKLV